MALPTSGAISLFNVNNELGISGTQTISMGSSNVRTLAGRSSGSISMSHLHGKSNVVWNMPPSTISAEDFELGKAAAATARIFFDVSAKQWTSSTTNDPSTTQSMISSGTISTIYYRLYSKSANVTGDATTTSFVAMSSDKSWEVSALANNTLNIETGTIDIAFADNSSGIAASRKTITLTANANSEGGGGHGDL